jgi:hypothetical protein
MWSELAPTFHLEHVSLATFDRSWTIDTATTSVRLSGRARDFAIDPDGFPVVAFSRQAEGKELQVYSSRWDGRSWSPLGGSLNLNPTAYANFPSLVLDAQGIPTVVFLQASSGFKLVVKRWIGSKWEILGTPGSLGARDAKVALSLGAPVLAAIEPIVGLTVRQRSNAGWVDLGLVISTPNAFVDTVDLAVDSQGNPWLLWAEDDPNGQRLRLSHWTGRIWETLAPPPFAPKVATASTGG